MFKFSAHKETFVHVFSEDKHKQALKYCYDTETGKGTGKLSVPKTTAVKLIHKHGSYSTAFAQ